MSFQSKTENRIADDWAQLSRELMSRWPELNRDDLKATNGDSQKLIAIIHQKTGGHLKEIEQQVDQVAAQSAGLLSRVSGIATDTALDASQSVADAGRYAYQQMGEAAHQAYGQSRQLYHGAQDQVRQWPVAVLTAATAVGFLVGMALVPRRKPEPKHWWERS